MSDKLKLIVGLGNPGAQYASTRHNVGAWFIEQVAAGQSFKLEKKFKAAICKKQIAGQDVLLAIPTTFMNLSGEAVGAIANFYKLSPESILIAHDELDFPAGIAKLKFDGGLGGHNGLRSITSHLGTQAYYRLRIGIDHPGIGRDVSDYVLSKPSRADREEIEASLWQAEKVLDDVVDGEFERAMHQLHS
jgi:peptidyl-tRNA hydrolase, PTH1 family